MDTGPAEELTMTEPPGRRSPFSQPSSLKRCPAFAVPPREGSAVHMFVGLAPPAGSGGK